MYTAKYLGFKIRRLREEKEISREVLCNTQEVLTVRQLARIEKGEAIPKLETLFFIAYRLKIHLHLLLDNKTLHTVYCHTAFPYCACQ